MDLTELRNRVLRKLEHLGINVDDVDAELNMVQRQYIQPYARMPGTVQHTTTDQNEVVLLGDIAEDIYRINFITDVTGGKGLWIEVPLVSDFSVISRGARVHDGSLYLQGIDKEKTLTIAYWKKLRELGVGENLTTIPDVPEQWHDLYVTGAVAMIESTYYPMFSAQHQEFRRERLKESRPLKARSVYKGWW